jgi:hypothetical protein
VRAAPMVPIYSKAGFIFLSKKLALVVIGYLSLDSFIYFSIGAGSLFEEFIERGEE